MAEEEVGIKLSEEAEIFQDQEVEEPVIELGDRIRINGGKYDRTTGRVVYRTEADIHISPDGLTNQVVELDVNEEGFDPRFGIETVEILQKNNNIDTIIKNIEHRTTILMQHIKTEMGKTISQDKYKIIKMFIEDYYTTIHNYHNY